MKDPLFTTTNLIIPNKKEKRYNSFHFSKKDNFCALDFEVTNSLTYPQIYASGLCGTKNLFAKAFNLAKWPNIKDLFFKTNYHLKNNQYKTKTKKYFDQKADYLCTTNFAILIKILLSTRVHLKIITQNGSTYDLRFLMYLLPLYGGKLTNRKMDEFFIKYLNDHEKRPYFLEEFDFYYLADDNKKVYYLEIVTKNKQHILFFDDYLINKATLKEKGDLLGWKKLENENNYQVSSLYNNLQDFQNDGNEFAYLKRDCEITLFSFKKFFNFFSKQEGGAFFGITAPSIAFKTWKKYFAMQEIKKLIDQNIIAKERRGKFGIYYEIEDVPKLNALLGRKSEKEKTSLFYLIKAFYKKYFDDTWLQEKVGEFTDLKKRYLGGYTLLNNDPSIWIKLISDEEKLFSFDVNSMYAYIMASENLAPFGAPLPNVDKLNSKYYQFFTLRVLETMTTDLTPIFHQDINGLRSWIKTIKKNQTFSATTDMLENIKKRYDLNNFHIEIDYTFAAKPFKFFFGDYIKIFYQMKKKAKNETERYLAKLLLVSCYGKFGSNLQVEKNYYDIKQNIFLKEDDCQVGYYMPMAIAITSTARSYLQKQLENYYENLVYEDTDSLKIKATKEKIVEILANIKIDAKQLGAFKFEWFADTWLFKRTKNYFAWNHEAKKCYFANNGVNWKNEWQFYNENNPTKIAKWQTKEEQEQTAYWYFSEVVNIKELFGSYDLKNQKDNNNINGVGVAIFKVSESLTALWEYPSYKEQKIKNKKLKNLVYNYYKQYKSYNNFERSINNLNMAITKKEIEATIKEAQELYKLHQENPNLFDDYKQAKKIIKHFNSFQDEEPKKTETAKTENTITLADIANNLNNQNENKTALQKENKRTINDIAADLGISYD